MCRHALFQFLLLPTVVFSNGIETLIGITGKDFVLLAADASLAAGGVAIVGPNFDKITRISQHTAVAAAGDPADTDRLTALLNAENRRRSYEDGPIVQRFDCSTGQRIDSTIEEPTGYSVECLAEAARSAIVGQMRKQNPYRVSLLVAGMSGSGGSPNASAAHSVQQQLKMTSARLKELSLHVDNNDGEMEGLDGPLLLGDNALRDEKLDSGGVLDQDTSLSATGTPRLYWLDEYGSMQQIPYAVHGHASSLLWSLIDREWKPDLTRVEAMELIGSCLKLLEKRFIISSKDFCIKCLDSNGCERLR